MGIKNFDKTKYEPPIVTVVNIALSHAVLQASSPTDSKECEPLF